MTKRGLPIPGDLVRQARDALGGQRYGRHRPLPQEDLADALNTGRRTVQDWEAKGAPTVTLFALVGLLFDRGRNEEAVKLLQRHRQREFVHILNERAGR